MRRAARELWRWWNEPWMARWGRFVLFVLACFAFFAFLRRYPATRADDANVAIFIAVCAVLVILTTAYGVVAITGSWTLRATGLVGFMVGVVCLHTWIANGYYHWFPRHPNPWLLDFARAYYVPGVLTLIAGMVLWSYREARARRNGDRDKGI